jgi:hypothetical protein
MRPYFYGQINDCLLKGNAMAGAGDACFGGCCLNEEPALKIWK